MCVPVGLPPTRCQSRVSFSPPRGFFLIASRLDGETKGSGLGRGKGTRLAASPFPALPSLLAHAHLEVGGRFQAVVADAVDADDVMAGFGEAMRGLRVPFGVVGLRVAIRADLHRVRAVAEVPGF